jgi:hypothetical protein
MVSGFVKPSGTVAERLFGAWRYLGTTIDGQPRPGRGAAPKGIISYDPSGYVVAHIAPDRSFPDGAPTPEQSLDVLANTVAYFGTYTVDEAAGTVTHHRHANVRPGEPADAVRRYTFSGNRLILRPIGSTQDVLWERM